MCSINDGWYDREYPLATHPDGWKDEEGDVDDIFKHLPKKAELPSIKAPSTSAQPCGCDTGANWVCARHRKDNQ